MCRCLKKCEEKGAKSIAFPSIGTGNLGYPNNVVAKIMVKEIFDYFSFTKKSVIKTVYLTIFMSDTYMSFQAEVSSYAPGDSKRQKKRRSNFSRAGETPGIDTQQKSFHVNNITVNIICGDITASQCDAIVNPTDSKITLTGQGVAGAILQKGGDELKQLCHVLTSNGKVLDDTTLVLETRATGSLQCKSVFHIIIL